MSLNELTAEAARLRRLAVTGDALRAEAFSRLSLDTAGKGSYWSALLKQIADAIKAQNDVDLRRVIVQFRDYEVYSTK